MDFRSIIVRNTLFNLYFNSAHPMNNKCPKIIALFIFFMLTGTLAKAQDLVEFLATEACTCVTDLVKMSPSENPEEDLGKCIEAVFEENLEAIEEIYGENFGSYDSEAFRKLGEEVGIKMAKDCKIFMELFVKKAQNDKEKETEYFKKGEAHLNAGETDLAISAYSSAIEINPKKADYYNQRGVAYFRNEDYYRAISDFYRAVEILPKYHRPFHNMAFSKYQLQDFMLALADVDTAIAIDGEYVASHNLRGLILNELGKTEEARVSFDRAMQLDDKDPDFPYNVGYTYFEERNYEKALEFFLKAESRGGNSVTVLSKIGNCYDILGNHPKAVEYHSKCIALDEADYGLYYNRGLAYLSMEAYKEAKDDFEKALTLEKEDVDVYFNLSKAYKGLGDLAKSLDLIEQSMAMDTRNASYYDLRAGIFESQGKLDRAIEDYTVSISLYPDDCEIHLALGKLFLKTENPTRAKGYFQNAVDKGCEEAEDLLGNL
jgi:tetratricopeptide (TPR) repeat protein